MDEFIIQASGVSKIFEIPAEPRASLREHVTSFFTKMESRQLIALNDISFSISRGDFLGIIGANGSGKTTLMRILAGIYAADEGDVEVNGKVAPLLELGIGFNGELSARDNIMVNGTLMGIPRVFLKEHLLEILEYAGLSDFGHMKVKNFSSGMWSRLAFAVASHVEAETYLLDEVMAVGDYEFREKCLASIENLKNAGRTVVLTTHDTEFVKKNCSHCLYLDHGKLAMYGSPDECVDKYLNT